MSNYPTVILLFIHPIRLGVPQTRDHRARRLPPTHSLFVPGKCIARKAQSSVRRSSSIELCLLTLSASRAEKLFDMNRSQGRRAPCPETNSSSRRDSIQGSTDVEASILTTTPPGRPAYIYHVPKKILTFAFVLSCQPYLVPRDRPNRLKTRRIEKRRDSVFRPFHPKLGA